MNALLSLLGRAARSQVENLKRAAATNAGFGLAIAIFALLALIFAVALGVHALALWIGMVGALAVGLGLSLLGCLVAWLMLRAARQRAQAERQAEETRLMREALQVTLPLLRSNPTLTIGLAMLAGFLLSLGGGSGSGGGSGKDRG
ncbi:hypothetical protein [Acidimangrovimonas pyrenivorans]|uniref:Phage holin family protein n=1 Tax=Acidimangrovimonas pyrenivorans TaxID=2030798 RepID=A0ABV7ABC0_9RHOB